MGVLTWRLLSAADLPMLARWLQERGAIRWWNHEYTLEAVKRDFGGSVRGDEPGQDLVISLDDHLIGRRFNARRSATTRKTSPNLKRP